MPGNILLTVLQMFAVPLIVTSVLAGVTGLNTKMSKKIALITGVYVCISTVFSTCYAMSLVLSVAPGVEEEYVSEERDIFIPFSMHVVFMDLFRNMVPESFFQAFFEKYKTDIIYLTKDTIIVEKPMSDSDIRLEGNYVPGANMLGLIIWSFTIGILINRVGDKAKSTTQVIQFLNDAIKIIIQWVVWYLPIGVFFLIAVNVLDVENWKDAIKFVKFGGVVCLGLGFFTLIILPTVYFVLVRQNPFTFFNHVSEALITAFTSSSAALPVALQCCEENVKVNKKLLRIMLPITVSINMNGTAIYEVIASVFISQINDIKLEVSQIIAICLTSSIVTFGTAGVPARGTVNTIMVLTSVGLPAEDAVILVVFEWLLDHFTSMVNMLSNMMGLTIIDYLWEADLLVLEEDQRTDKIRLPSEFKLDLTCLEPDEESLQSSISPSESTISK